MTIERPILFSAPMVRAILDGRKTVTRRIVRWPRAATLHGRTPAPEWSHAESDYFHAAYGGGDLHDETVSLRIGCPYGAVGDHLWVRESIYYSAEHDNFYFGADNKGCGLEVWGRLKKRSCPSIHMPRWASRITLEVTDVRVERLQEITEEDAQAEGVNLNTLNGLGDQPIAGENRGRSKDTHPNTLAFAMLWDSINGDRASWASNPWVWRVAFKRFAAAGRAFQ